MEEQLTSLLYKKNGEILDCNEWNKLVRALIYLLENHSSEEGCPTKVSELENDSNYISLNNIVTILQQLINNGTLSGLKGPKGDTGATGPKGDKGDTGTQGLQGELGLQGETGPAGQDGSDGKSAYEIAVENGFEGTEQQWLLSLIGAIGKSAYLLALDAGFSGTLLEWLESLKGLNGQDGSNGQNGKSAYLSYLDTTTDNPPLTELQWSANTSNGSSRFTDENEEIIYNVNNNDHDYVDLCLPSGTLWATMNLGASSILDEGLRYTWGGLQGYTLQLIDGHQVPFPYNNLNIEILSIEYDAARTNWGGDWEIPTENQVKELVNYTTKEVIQIEGITVLKFISKLNSQKYIYFPVCSKDIYIDTLDNCYHILDRNYFYIWLKEGEYYHSSDSLTTYADGLRFRYGPGYTIGSYLTYDRGNLSLIRPVINNPDGYHRRLQEVCFTGSYKDLYDVSVSYKDLTDTPKNVSDFKNNNFYLTSSSINNQYLTAPSYLVDSYKNSHYCDNLFGTYWSNVDIGQDSTHSQGMLFRAGDPTGHYPSENFLFTEQSYRDYLSQKNSDDYYLIESELNIYNPVSQNFGIHWRYPTKDDIKNLYIYFERYSSSEKLQFRKVGSDSGISISFRLTTPDGAMIRIKNGVAYLKENDYIIYEYEYRGGTNYFLNLEEKRYGGYTIRPILNIPKEVSRVAITGDYDNLINKPTIPAAQIQADWNQTDNTKVDYIKNKPTITNGTNGKSAYLSYVDTTSDNPVLTEQQWVASLQGTNGTNGTNGQDGITPHIDSTSKHWMIGSTDTNIVAEGLDGTNGTDGVTPHIDSTTGNWFIGNTDTGVHAQGPAGQDGNVAGQVQADWDQSDNTQVSFIRNKPTLFSGNYNDLSNKPTIPDALIQSDWNLADSTAKDFVKNKPTLFSGSYNDLSNKPTIPVIWSGTQAQYDAIVTPDANTIYIITSAS